MYRYRQWWAALLQNVAVLLLPLYTQTYSDATLVLILICNAIFVLATTKKEIVIKDSAYNLQHLKYVTFKLKSNCIVVS